MRRLSEYTCNVCGESDYGKAPHCKCEREYERKERERLSKNGKYQKEKK